MRPRSKSFLFDPQERRSTEKKKPHSLEKRVRFLNADWQCKLSHRPRSGAESLLRFGF